MLKKIVVYLVFFGFNFTLLLNLIACNSNVILEITNDDIYDDNIEPIKLNKIANMFLFAEPTKSKCPKRYFSRWNWTLDNRKKIKGTNSCGDLDTYPWEDWTLFIQKTRSKGLYVSEWYKNVSD